MSKILIPAGSFQMGDAFNEGYNDERPVHTVYLDAFYMDVHEVTVGQYKQFVQATGHRAPDWSHVAEYSPTDEHPIIYVSWNDAVAYCEWIGKRLPTEAEWEYAARGGLDGKRFSWGNDIPHDNANYSDTNNHDQWSNTFPVGSFTPNGYGLYDMSGNVWEWCADWYGSGYYASSPRENPIGPKSPSYRVIRGGSWLTPSFGLRVAYRAMIEASCTLSNTGFRCANNLYSI